LLCIVATVYYGRKWQKKQEEIEEADES